MKNILSIIYLCAFSILLLCSCQQEFVSDDNIQVEEELIENEKKGLGFCQLNCILPIGYPALLSSSTIIESSTLFSCGNWVVDPSSKFDKCGKVVVRIYDDSCEEIDSFQVSPGSTFTLNALDYPTSYCSVMVVVIENSCGTAKKCIYNGYAPGPIIKGNPIGCVGC